VKTTRPRCGTVVLIGTGRPCHIAVLPWLCSSYLARLGCFEVEMIAWPFGVFRAVIVDGKESMKVRECRENEGVSSGRLLTQNSS